MSSTDNHQQYSPSAQLMAIEVISELLLSTSPHKLGEALTAHLRELTGARTVMVLAHRPEPDLDELLYASPQRRSRLFSSAELNLFCRDKTPGELSFLAEELSADHPLQAPLLRAGVRSMARYPLRAGGEMVAQLLLFDLPGLERIAETSQIINLLAAPISLALKNALAFRLIEKQAQELELRVEERTAELRQSEHQLKQQKTRLEQRNRVLRQFNYAVSHELKTPLVSIESSLGLIQSTLPQTMDPELTRAFGYARHAARQMNRLLESLLLMFRIDTEDTGAEGTPFRVLVQDAVDQLTKGNKLKGIKLTIAAEGPVLFGDRDKLVQIWLHLIDNAAKYMGDQKHPAIDIRVERTDHEVLFLVRDNGMGIEKPYQGKIFGLFDQLDKTADGMGLGLTLVKRIVDYYGGTIRVESAGANQGSSFYFTLPDALINKDTTT